MVMPNPLPPPANTCSSDWVPPLDLADPTGKEEAYYVQYWEKDGLPDMAKALITQTYELWISLTDVSAISTTGNPSQS
ncbi:hypothetical protein N7481_011444 [Penicillium waksmanii]|uniref:uncharacterized protein n=1 Tax=Penicillium waksmanii TaxID=69791 RepID=UPI002548FF6F|nr:uncharacterized protein N7481_011444 [Penicillium waksmanii]KAJ5974234.1 hypothetical protein N7481_011444 [Penicillium waksmanii]